MSDAEQLPLAEYLPALEHLGKIGVDFILVAGQAVNFWADYYKEREQRLLAFLPFTSKDVDLFGSVEDLFRLPEILTGELKRYRDVRQPVIGVFTTDTVPPLKFELLRSIYGSVRSAKIKKRSKKIGAFRIIDPVSLLAAKCHNASGINQEYRQDVRQVQMMVLVTNAFMSDIISEIGGLVTPRQFIDELKYFFTLADIQQFQEGLEMAGNKVSECLPLNQIRKIGKCIPAIGRFIENTLQPKLKSLSK